MTALADSLPAANSNDAGVKAIGLALAAPREQIESTFLAVGARLSEGATLLHRITKVFEGLPAELQGPELVEAFTRLTGVGTQAKAISAMFATEQADLFRLVDVVAAAHHPIGELRRTVKMMSIVAINARVVAASVVGDGDEFDVFTTDIAKLSDSATATIQAFTAAYRQLTEEVGQAVRQRGQFENAHSDTLDALALDIGKALDELGRQRAVSAASTAETGRVSRQIIGRIANAVMALQVGDATRQRIEHIEGGLEALSSLVEHGQISAEDARTALSAVGGLQLTQLMAAVDALEADVLEAGIALRDLAADAGAIMTQSRAVYGEGSAEGSSLAMLNQAVRHAANVLRDCEAERTKLEAVASAVLETVGVLLSHVEAVQEIEANMRLVSLNAAVKCAQLGPRGAALNVIARQLRELTTETVAAAQAAMASLHEAAGLAQSFGAAANGDTAGRVGQLEQEASAALTMLEHVDGALAQALSALNRDGPAVISLLGTAVDTFDGLTAIAETMRDLQMQLAAQCNHPVADQLPDIVLEMLSAHRARYTMEAERRIHEQMFGADPVAPAPVAAEPEEPSLDDFFF